MPTEAETAAALEASIKHWEDNERATRPEDYSVGWGACALCVLFRWRSSSVELFCTGCPVSDSTLLPGCGGTPYDEAYYAHAKWDMGRLAKRPPEIMETLRQRASAAAKEMVEFLKGLRK